MSMKDTTNFESFLAHISPNIAVNFYTQGSSSSRGNAEESVRKPYVGLRDIWSAYETWSSYAVGVPLELIDPRFDVTQFYVPNSILPRLFRNFAPTSNLTSYYLPTLNVTQYYVPYLSAIQIFTNKPFAGGFSSSRSFGKDCYLHFQYNETESFDIRPPLIAKVEELAQENHELNHLTSSDLSHYSWFSVAWSPLYQIPRVTNVKALSVFFLTYHSLTPLFPETFPQGEHVGLPPFGVVTSKLSHGVWDIPGTSDQQNLNMHEESAASWLEKLKFKHSDFDMFMAEKSNDLPLPRRL